jgi:TrmH family RNA methyltransferase
LRPKDLDDPGMTTEYWAASANLLRSARRLLRRKERERASRFLAEGPQAVTEALAVGAAVDILVADEVVERHVALLDRAVADGVRVSVGPSSALIDLADTVHPQNLLAVCRLVDVPVAEAMTGSPRLVVLCDMIRDPGNLGTVVRCADAFGADAVLVSRDSVDLYNPKAVRASTGSLFHLPLAVEVDLDEAVSLARDAGLAVLGADSGAPETTEDLRRTGALAGPVLWVLGNEAWGLPAERANWMDRLVGLPMYGRAESLNLATAAAVLLYATATAQRASEPQTQVPRTPERS